MLSCTVAENRNGSSLTTAIERRRLSRSTERTSAPSMETEPAVTSYRRGSSETSADLPEPIAPTSATTCPAGTSRAMPESAGGGVDLRLAIEHLEDARAGRGRPLSGAEHVPERLHGGDEHQQVGVEGG